MEEYIILEFNGESQIVYYDESEARKDLEYIKEHDIPGIWQLYKFDGKEHKMIDEFIGGIDEEEQRRNPK